MVLFFLYSCHCGLRRERRAGRALDPIAQGSPVFTTDALHPPKTMKTETPLPWGPEIPF